MKQLSILLFLCASLLIPQTATAQEFDLFAAQKVVVAPIRDMNDRKLSDGVKQMIRQGIVDACTSSNAYEVYEINIDDIKRQLSASGQATSFANICKRIGTKADRIIFTNVKLSSSAIGTQDVNIYITSSIYRIDTASEERSHFVTAQPTSQSILSETSDLVKVLLGLKTSSSSQQSRDSYSQSSSYSQTQSRGSYSQSGSYSQTQSSYVKTYRVGDYYNENGKSGVVFVVTPDGQHGKIINLTNLDRMSWNSAVQACNNLGNGWRLPTKGELLAIYKVKSTLDQTLAPVGDTIDVAYWSSTEMSSYYAWFVDMNNGVTHYNSKNDNLYVRAVSAF